MRERKEVKDLAQEHEDAAEEPLPKEPARFDREGTQNEQFYLAHNNQTEGGYKVSPFLLLPLFSSSLSF